MTDPGSEFLNDVLAHLAEGVKTFRTDRAENPDFTDAELVHSAGTMVTHFASLETAVLLSTVAMYRITQLEDALREMLTARHKEHSAGQVALASCHRPSCVSVLELLGDHGD